MRQLYVRLLVLTVNIRATGSSKSKNRSCIHTCHHFTNSRIILAPWKYYTTDRYRNCRHVVV